MVVSSSSSTFTHIGKADPGPNATESSMALGLRRKSKIKVRQPLQKILIPVSIFNRELSSLETIVKYLREVLNLKNKEISNVINRNVRTIWTTYQNAIEKLPKRFSLDDDEGENGFSQGMSHA